MDRFFTFLKSNISSLISITKHVDRYLYLLIYGLFFLPTVVIADGSKELYPNDANETFIFLCTDKLDHCANPPISSGGQRTEFAVYDCGISDRLNFVINSTDEVVYVGFQWDYFNWGSDFDLVYRVKNSNGDIVVTETMVPTVGSG